MDRGMGRTIVKLLIVSLILGLVLSFFDISPQGLLRSLGATVEDIAAILASLLEWSIGYILIGAVVVVPIWLILRALRIARNKR